MRKSRCLWHSPDGVERASNFLRGCAGISDRREQKSHAVRRVRPDTKRPVRGLGEPQQAHRKSQRDIQMPCLPTLSEISDTGNQKHIFIRNRAGNVENTRKNAKKFLIKKWAWTVTRPCPFGRQGEKFLIKIFPISDQSIFSTQRVLFITVFRTSIKNEFFQYYRTTFIDDV